MKVNKLLFVIFALALLAGVATALQIDSATIGDNKQDRVANVTATFVLKNNNTATISSLQVTTNADGKYNIAFTNVPTSLAAGASQTITVTGTIPLDLDAVDKTTLEEKAIKIGELTATGKIGSKTYTSTSDLNMQAVNQLELKKVKVSCGTKDESLDDGERMEELKPDTKDCSFTVEVENNFRTSDKNNLKIGDIEFDPATVEVESDDSDVDLDDEDDISGFDAGDEEEVSFDFDIDEEADDGTYIVTVRAFGTDDNGAFHGEEWEVKLEVERLKHDIQFQKTSIMPPEVEACDENIIKISTTIINMGRRDEDEAAVELRIPDLKFAKKIEDIELDRDDKTTLHFDVTLPKDTREGIYRGTLKSYFDNVAESRSKTIEITVIKCSDVREDLIEIQTPEQKEETTTVVVPQQTTTPQIPPTVTEAKTSQPAEKGFTESGAYVGLLIALVVLLLIAIGVIVVVFFVKKK